MLESAGNLKQWIEIQSIGLAAFRRNLPDEGGSRKLLGKYLEAALAPGHRQSIIRRSPPAVLNMLLDIRPERLSPALRARREQWTKWLNSLTTTIDNLSVIGACGFVADYTLQGYRCDPPNLLHLWDRLSSRYPFMRIKEADFVTGTAQALCVLRAPKTTDAWLDEKLQAVEDLIDFIKVSRIASLGRVYWAHIANAIYHRLFAWPLLVNAESLVGSAISLPVAVSVLYDNRDDVRIVDTPFIRVHEWWTPLRNAVVAAKDLWIRAHRNYGYRVEEVRFASVTFDFRYASAIVEPFGAVYLGDESMGACFVQAVLGELLGKRVQMRSAVTGCVGPRPGYQLTWPSRIEQKLRYVFRSRSFEKIVLPTLDTCDPRLRERIELYIANHRGEQSAEINFVKGLQHLADSIHVAGWRAQKYVRCPEIAATVHARESSQAIARSDERITECLRILQDKDQALVTLPDEINGQHVASALMRVNAMRRKPGHLDPISWAFVRCVESEADEQLWYVLWHLMGAPHESFRRFQLAQDSDEAARIFAEAMNTFSPPSGYPAYRAPDVLVIIGTAHTAKEIKPRPNPASRPLAFNRILAGLPAAGVMPVDRNFQRAIGKTRIVLIPADSFCDRQFALPEDERFSAELRQLSIFRFGFSQQMAACVLDPEQYVGRGVRDLLAQLVVLGYVRRTISGEYYLIGRIGKENDKDDLDKSAVDARLHYRAGCSLVPYLVENETRKGVPEEKAWMPEFVHEAQYHFLMAAKKRAGDKWARDEQALAVSHAQLLQQYCDAPGWFLTSGVMASQVKHAYEYARGMVADHEKLGHRIHPMWHLSVATACDKWIMHSKEDDEFDNQFRLQLRQEALTAFRAAIEACDGFPEERDVNWAQIVTQLDGFSLRHGCTAEELCGVGLTGSYNAEALEMILQGRVPGDIATGEWLARRGDEQHKHTEAFKIYKLGVSVAPDYRQLWIKLIGAYALSIPYYDVKQILRGIPELSSLTLADLEMLYQWQKKFFGSKGHHAKPASKKERIEGDRKNVIDSRIAAGQQALSKIIEAVTESSGR